MPDQYRIAIMHSHNLNRGQILPEQITTGSDCDNARYKALIHSASR